jgi:hypothetical protein
MIGDILNSLIDKKFIILTSLHLILMVISLEAVLTTISWNLIHESIHALRLHPNQN